ncbi:2,3-dihydro-2,3-dihydroxybenzoate dehydrogenase [Paenalcaligenes sp. Me131]|uniref:2,3-dihydro-2,3-dihydroxybenzoate dehydrogenase n=1 Tax=Paenalcaligenes sp. Me131 TaxID=3392636 RepID=UPI003D28D3D8
MYPEFQQQHVLVSGAASGIGENVAQQLLESGARITALDLHTDTLDALVKQYPDQILVLRCDVGNFDEVAEVVSKAEAHFGTIHKLVCAAGRLQMGDITDLTAEQWQKTFTTNTNGVFNLCHHVGLRLKAQKRGAIVNISSNAATSPRMSMGAYAASKAAVTQMSRCLALELAAYNVRVNVVSPGSTDTPMQQAMWQQGSSRETVIAGSGSHYRLGIPLQKIATPAEIANGVLFLLSDQASHITLHDLRIDGGATLDQ